MSTHQYSISTDFPNQAVDTEVLLAEINGSSLGATHSFSVSDDGADTVTVEATPDLTGPEVTTLDGIIGSHQGVPFVEGTQRLNSLAEQNTNAGGFQQAAQFVSGPLRGGSYLLTFSYEIMLDTQDANSGCQARVLWNGGTEIATSATGTTVYDLRAASAPLDVNDGDTPTITIEFRRIGTANTARIRRMRIALAPLDEEA